MQTQVPIPERWVATVGEPWGHPGGAGTSSAAGRNPERAERMLRMDAATDAGTRGKITGDMVWPGQPRRMLAARGRSRLKLSGETIFIRFALWLLEACWRICSQTNRGRRNACEWIQTSPYGVVFFVVSFFFFPFS